MRILKKIGENKKLLIIAGVLVAVILVAMILWGIGNRESESPSDHNGKKQESMKKEELSHKDKNEKESTGISVEPEEDTASAEPEATTMEENKTEAVEPTEIPTPTPVAVSYPESEGGRKVYLTFDDGTSVQTDRILDILKQYGVKATFFVTAQSGEENAARYRRIVAEGHSIGLHSVTHRYKEIYASLDTFIADVEGIRQFVLNTTGVNSYLYRFPGGSSNAVSTVPIEDCIRYLNQSGYRYFDWNIDTADSVNRSQSVDELVSRALGEGIDKYHNCVILMHDAKGLEHTVEALPRIIEGLQTRGLEILPITEATPVVQHKKASSVQ